MILLRKTILLFFTFFLSVQINAQDTKPISKFKDSLDGAIDLSNFLLNLHGVLPVVMPITEPAVDYGAAAIGLYFLGKENKEGDKKKPDVIAAGGGYTGNDTWFAGGGYIGFWNNDNLRYRGILGYGNINLTYYGLSDRNFARNPKEYNIQSWFFLQQAVWRIKNSNFFLGGKYQLTKTSTRFFENIDFGNLELINSGLSFISEFENYDNIFSPTQGTRIHFSYDQNLEFLGSDIDFSKANFFSLFYFGGTETWTPALRVEMLYSSDNTPFYAKPYVKLRGVPAVRYQGNFTALVETEHEFSISRRWSIVGFGGVGAAFKAIDDLNTDETVWNVGSGFRYLIARQMGLKMGVDVARGPEEFGFYVTVGSSWIK